MTSVLAALRVRVPALPAPPDAVLRRPRDDHDPVRGHRRGELRHRPQPRLVEGNFLGLTVPFLATGFGIFLHAPGVPADPEGAAGSSRHRRLRPDAPSSGASPSPSRGPSSRQLAVFSFLGAWNQYLWPALLATTTRRIQDGPDRHRDDRGQQSRPPAPELAGAMISLVPLRHPARVLPEEPHPEPHRRRRQVGDVAPSGHQRFTCASRGPSILRRGYVQGFCACTSTAPVRRRCARRSPPPRSPSSPSSPPSPPRRPRAGTNCSPSACHRAPSNINFWEGMTAANETEIAALVKQLQLEPDQGPRQPRQPVRRVRPDLERLPELGRHPTSPTS